ncbi:ParB/RepB/Spo0J family partition protein [Tropicibacter oceani]|uniref:ParB N-terminal domain-containing protein n=1 Tax=Tropicibacter oceani TaxID=3058420 RepID=A0ABY8QPQ7_9RHOB|nr:ParB N-terminal domain-containing protein [Tropicibacter oceani]WGW06038.1 ParB N-terminal domain-containing protein [Tropicibacter oceani]
MARKRLTPANPMFIPDDGALAPKPLPRAPIADVAGDASATSALRELSDSIEQARANGRMVLDLPLSAVVLDHLVRDRVLLDEGELETLVTSIRARGQQNPIEVVALGDGRYGLISGWRRCQAIARLAQEGEGPGTVQALLRRPEDAPEAYQAMVEENEIRVGLSYFERARIALKAVDAGVFETEKAALLTLFQSASRPKRSKIRSFARVVQALDGALRFPAALGERLGLALAKVLEEDPGLALALTRALGDAAPDSPEAEQAVIQSIMKRRSKAAIKARGKPGPQDHQIAAGLKLRVKENRIEITGAKVDEAFQARLMAWLEAEMK